MEKINELLKCKYCNERLENPVVLPCGETICEEHISDDSVEIECKVCNKKHEIPVCGLVKNKLVARLIEVSQQITHHQPTHKPVTKVKAAQKHGQETLKRVQKILDDYEHFNSTRVVLIYDFFSKLTNKLDIFREENNDKYTDDVYSKISQYQKECKASNTTFDELIEENIKDLTAYVNSLSSPKLDDHALRKIETKLHSTKYAEELESIKGKLFLGKTVEFVLQNFDFNKIVEKNIE